ncbi:DUF6976 family protein [Desulfopila aestuarii]|uniref:Uncharacterized protein n=1 Tax=Desulfopila aestuarii DSM 18488 TaxID=1121416 RepID=A0A1M7XVL7_9BACT|nr:hypothetical protein [Desulfopila aestuarii]SHO42696.1 hypothetical protein SAMN02745220_00098 [Desulfopila aestuarii DSM 18488]
MQQDILTSAEVAKFISEGKTLLLAGDEALLGQLPKGKWIGGTIPYFISPEQGGMVSKDKIFVTDISAMASKVEIQAYDQNQLGQVYCDGGESGFSFIIIPAMSEVHSTFAINAPNYKDFGARPLIGWISGVHLDDLGKISPKVVNGESGEVLEKAAIVMHVTLPPGKVIDVGIVNIFEQSAGDTLTFPDDGFSCTDVNVNGVKENFAAYIERNKLDTKLPLVADYYGALVNISFQNVDQNTGEVAFYAPVFSGVRYKHAKAVEDYASAFTTQLQKIGLSDESVVFSCNCILNYLYSGLEGKSTAPFVGPITFGEIAYQLLNQTLVYLQVYDS